MINFLTIKSWYVKIIIELNASISILKWLNAIKSEAKF